MRANKSQFNSIQCYPINDQMLDITETTKKVFESQKKYFIIVKVSLQTLFQS
jgi:hypothetical protein